MGAGMELLSGTEFANVHFHGMKMAAAVILRP